eukprot:m.24589 g.24589  ORF g.24589 m.24589 type:complete len:575 (+) comp7621_c0_seq1:155-1879(+)
MRTLTSVLVLLPHIISSFGSTTEFKLGDVAGGKWNVGANGQVTVSAQTLDKASTGTWVGIGIGQSMFANTDAIIGWLDSDGNVKVRQYHLGTSDPTNFVLIEENSSYIDLQQPLHAKVAEGIMSFEITLKKEKLPANADGSIDTIYASGADWSLNPATLNGYHTVKSDGNQVSLRAATPSAVTSAPVSSTSPTNGRLSKNLGGTVVISWKKEASLLHLEVTGQSNWVSVAFGGSMIGADAIVGYSQPESGVNSYLLKSFQASDFVESPIQLQQSECSYGDGVLTFSAIVSYDALPVDSAGFVPLIWATGDTWHPHPTQSDEHKHTSHGTIHINFASGESTQDSEGLPTIVLIHGILMGLAWLLVVPVAVLTALFKKDVGDKWMTIHKWLNSIAMVMVMLAFLLIVIHKGMEAGEGGDDEDGDHDEDEERDDDFSLKGVNLLESWHGKCGVAALVGIFIQVIMGFLRPPKGESMRRKVWFVSHRIFACFAMAAAFLSIFFSFDEVAEHTGKNKDGWQIALAAYVALIFGISAIRIFILRATRINAKHTLMSSLNESGDMDNDYVRDDVELISVNY